MDRLETTTDSAEGVVRKGRILRLKLGYNPNSSSIGTIVFAMPAALLGSMVAFGAVAGLLTAAVLHRKGDGAEAEPETGSDSGSGSGSDLDSDSESDSDSDSDSDAGSDSDSGADAGSDSDSDAGSDSDSDAGSER